MNIENNKDLEQVIIREIKANPNDIVARLLRLHSLSSPHKVLSEVEDAISEIINLRCHIRQSR